MSNIIHSGVKNCKKCGCELASDSKHNKCQNCMEKNEDVIRHIFHGVVSVVPIAITAVKVIPKIFKKK